MKEQDGKNDEGQGEREQEGSKKRRSLLLAMVRESPRCSPDSELKRLRNTKLLYLRPFVRFVSPGEAIFFLSFLHPEVFRPLYLIMPLRMSADLGAASKAMEKQTQTDVLGNRET